jgi:hypothetical protein
MAAADVEVLLGDCGVCAWHLGASRAEACLLTRLLARGVPGAGVAPPASLGQFLATSGGSNNRTPPREPIGSGRASGCNRCGGGRRSSSACTRP